MAEIFGLDFGTTNSLAAVVNDRKVSSLVDDTNRPHPSAVWYKAGRIVVGREAREQLSDARATIADDIVRSAKRYLGQEGGIFVGGVERKTVDVVAEILRYIKRHGEQNGARGDKFDRAVMTIPVALTGQGRRDLRNAAAVAGIRIEQFVHEPLAALYGYLRGRPDAEFKRKMAELESQLALVFDWGGGTLDLTLCKFIGGVLTQIANVGENNVGGDRFDHELMELVKQRHTELHGLDAWPDEMPGARAKLWAQCEDAKIALSSTEAHTVFVPNYLRAEGPARNLMVKITRNDLRAATKGLVDDGLSAISRLLDALNVRDSSIALCLPTGGMARMPAINSRLRERFGIQRVQEIPNGDRVIAEGAAWIAHDNLAVQLAKPLELVHADNSHIPILKAGTPLPREGQEISVPVTMYCVDPSDGEARFHFVRPDWPGRTATSDPRNTYKILTVKTDPTAQPLIERLELAIRVDPDLVVTVSAKSTGAMDEASEEIHDLEFGLGLQSKRPTPSGSPDGEGQGPRKSPSGRVLVRSNVTSDAGAKHLIPGHVLDQTEIDAQTLLHPRQRAEINYYKKCGICARPTADIIWNGCDICPPNAFSRAEVAIRKESGMSLWLKQGPLW
jgi:actin-like ATPase involved in cell morphogenesis